MHKLRRPFLLLSFLSISLISILCAEESSSLSSTEQSSFESFTGKVTKNKVRLRLQPSLDSLVLRELNKNDLIVITGESDDFYAVKPLADAKGYIFRTYVLDGVVEGNRVNVRLQPDTEAPIIAQLRAGDRVNGTISSLNSKWLEISPPDSARFYIAKEYVERMGPPQMIAQIEKRREEVNLLLGEAYSQSKREMQRPFSQIDLNSSFGILNQIVNQYKDFPEQTARAKELATELQDSYLQKKIAYLEEQAQVVPHALREKTEQLNNEIGLQKERVKQLEQQLENNRPIIRPSEDEITITAIKRGALSASNEVPSSNSQPSIWQPIEQKLFEGWKRQNNASLDDFYQTQEENAAVIEGILQPYDRLIKNKPGDFILLSKATKQPIAFLYSTRLDLRNKVGQEVSLKVSPRDNRHFAFPAYFVLSEN